MQFFKSLFCSQGFDNKARNFGIFSAIYTLFILLSPTLTTSIILFVLITALLTILLGLTSLRRLHDAKLNKNWLLAPCLSFILVSAIIVFTEQKISYFLLILPIICSTVILRKPSLNKRGFILGYFGPIDLREYQTGSLQQQAKFRIEPTLFNSDSASNYETYESHYPNNNIEQINYSSNHGSFTKQLNIGELFNSKLINNKTLQLIIFGLIGLSIIAFTVERLMNYTNEPNPQHVENNTSNSNGNNYQLQSLLHPLPMPDNYTLYLSEHSGISINWQADELTNTMLWSQMTTQGDESCQEITFDKGESIRTLSVQVENTVNNGVVSLNNYVAYFSPLDSQVLVQALAFRSNFSLCGYNFSLKGSQAALMGNEHYAQWVNY